MLAVNYQNQCKAYNEDTDPLLLELLTEGEHPHQGMIVDDFSYLLLHFYMILMCIR